MGRSFFDREILKPNIKKQEHIVALNRSTHNDKDRVATIFLKPSFAFGA
jgi:hypothetical protein